jgi:bla regulator protein BlaR1
MSATPHLMEMAAAVGALLLRSSIAGALAATLVWALCRLLPRLPATLRCLLWWGVCLKLMVSLAGATPLALPLLPAAADFRPAVARAALAAPIADRGIGRPMSDSGVPAAALDAPKPRPAAAAVPTGTATLAAFAALWMVAVLWQALRLGRQLLETRTRIARASRVSGADVLALSAALARRLGLRHIPDVLSSTEITSPQCIGLRRPRLLLPASATALAPGELEMAICHELVHLRRRDLWLGWVPAIAERLFFFHPLAILAAREYALSREAACDAEVLRRLNPSPQAYGRLLLKLTIAPRPLNAGAVAAAPALRTLKRRLAMLNDSSQLSRGFSRALPWLALGFLATLMPLQLVARQDAPAPAEANAIQAKAAPVKPALGPLAPRPIAAGQDHDPVIYVHGQTGDIQVSSGDVDVEELKEVHRLATQDADGDLLWFRHQGKTYIVRDEATLQQVREIFAPQQELGKRQGELGERQGALGEEQGRLGSEQGKLGAEMGKIGAELAEAASQGQASVRELEQRQEGLRKRVAELARRQEELGRQQSELGRQQGELGRQQEKVGREATAKLQALIERALASAIVKPLP